MPIFTRVISTQYSNSSWNDEYGCAGAVSRRNFLKSLSKHEIQVPVLRFNYNYKYYMKELLTKGISEVRYNTSEEQRDEERENFN